MKTLCVHHHLGLGDHIMMNGVIRLYAKKGDKVCVFSKNIHYSMIDFMYRDNDKIEVIEIDKEKNEIQQVNEACCRINPTKFIRIGFDQYQKYNSKGKNCYEVFYDQINFPYSVRSEMFYVKRDLENEDALFKRLNPNNDKFVFIHDDPERGFVLNRNAIINKEYKVIENDNSANIFWFIKIIKQAEEIHCMESSFKGLIDIYAQTDKLFFHDFRGHPFGNHLNENGKIIKY